MRYCMLLIGLLLAGCSEGAIERTTPTPCAELVAVGHTFIWLGATMVVVGIAARIALLTGIGAILSRIPGVAGVVTFLAELGAVAIACGLACAWLGGNPWILVTACCAALVAWGYHRRDVLLRWYNAWTNHSPKKVA